ncbi:MAG TPA: SWIM zinc finger family protein [Chloroflexota bacterium]|nr:SWIM zinc finger family protein [Chloroflexota bacterium]
MPPRHQWRDPLQFALDTKAASQVWQEKPGLWRFPSTENYAVTVQRDRVTYCSCPAGRTAGRCYHAAAVALALLEQWWAAEGLACDLSAIDDAAVLLPSVLAFLPATAEENAPRRIAA